MLIQPHSKSNPYLQGAQGKSGQKNFLRLKWKKFFFLGLSNSLYNTLDNFNSTSLDDDFQVQAGAQAGAAQIGLGHEGHGLYHDIFIFLKK